MSVHPPPLRVALVAGTLARGGAEKQLVYMAETLFNSGVDVRMYSLDEGGHYEGPLRELGVPITLVGAWSAPPVRLWALAKALRSFHPHITQAGHFFTNLYVTLAARSCGSVALGAIRSDTLYDVGSTGLLGRPSLRLPPSLLANSHGARRNARGLGVPAERIHVLANVIRLPETGDGAGRALRTPPLVVALVARLVPAKRIDRFLAALARARAEVPELRGLIVGEGPERQRLSAAAEALGLGEAVVFHGHSSDVPALLHDVSWLALTSDHEGFPNVLLEAMAAGLPVVTTPAGDAAVVVDDQATGYVVPFEDVEGMARCFVRLARSSELRRSLGDNGARRVREHYSTSGLAGRLLATYAEVAEQQHRQDVADLVKRTLTGP